MLTEIREGFVREFADYLDSNNEEEAGGGELK